MNWADPELWHAAPRSSFSHRGTCRTDQHRRRRALGETRGALAIPACIPPLSVRSPVPRRTNRRAKRRKSAHFGLRQSGRRDEDSLSIPWCSLRTPSLPRPPFLPRYALTDTHRARRHCLFETGRDSGLCTGWHRDPSPKRSRPPSSLATLHSTRQAHLRSGGSCRGNGRTRCFTLPPRPKPPGRPWDLGPTRNRRHHPPYLWRVFGVARTLPGRRTHSLGIDLESCGPGPFHVRPLPIPFLPRFVAESRAKCLGSPHSSHPPNRSPTSIGLGPSTLR